MTRRHPSARGGWPALALLAASLPAHAATVYVTDRIEVGLHETAGTDSVILELLPSGAELELLERDGALARVVTATGATGWVDGRYLTDSRPAVRRLTDLGAELDQAAAELVKSRETRAELEYQLRQAEERARVAEEELLDAQDRLTAPEAPAGPALLTSGTLREMQNLAEENQRLKQQLAELSAAREAAAEATPGAPSPEAAPAPGAPASAPPPAGPVARYLGILDWERWQQGLLAAALLLAFALGAWLVDWLTRRRHGGFRI